MWLLPFAAATANAGLTLKCQLTSSSLPSRFRASSRGAPLIREDCCGALHNRCIITWCHGLRAGWRGAIWGCSGGLRDGMPYRFNPPPNWPAPPSGWVPPPDWRPSPDWPAPPAGWQLWIEDTPIPSHIAGDPGAAGSPLAGGRHRRAESADSAPAVSAVVRPPASDGERFVPQEPAPGTPRPKSEEKAGLFGAHKRLDAVLTENRDLAQARDALVRENEHLRQQVTRLMGMSVAERTAEAERARSELQAQVAAVQADLSRVEQQAAHAQRASESGASRNR